jgi:hypothetical protein
MSNLSGEGALLRMRAEKDAALLDLQTGITAEMTAALPEETRISA